MFLGEPNHISNLSHVCALKYLGHAKKGSSLSLSRGIKYLKLKISLHSTCMRFLLYTSLMYVECNLSSYFSIRGTFSDTMHWLALWSYILDITILACSIIVKRLGVLYNILCLYIRFLHHGHHGKILAKEHGKKYRNAVKKIERCSFITWILDSHIMFCTCVMGG